MNRNFGAFAAVLLTFCLAAYACTSGEVVDGPLTGTGGSGNTTGRGGSGNTVGNGGTMGQAGRGGTTGTAGNTVGAAGTTGRGGTTGTGAVVGQAGTTGRGGTTGTGAVGQAGTTGTGAVGQAGTTGSGGNGSVTCNGTFETSADGFVRAAAVGGGCWHGYSFAGGDAGSTITPKDFSACGTPCSLHMSGTVGAAVAPSYAGVAYVGFNLGQDSGASTVPTITPTGASVTVAFTATTATLPLRAQLSGSGSTFWCYTITGASPVTIPYAMFNTACWDGSGTAYAKGPITNFELVVPGGATATSGVSVTLTSLKEN